MRNYQFLGPLHRQPCRRLDRQPTNGSTQVVDQGIVLLVGLWFTVDAQKWPSILLTTPWIWGWTFRDEELVIKTSNALCRCSRSWRHSSSSSCSSALSPAIELPREPGANVSLWTLTLHFPMRRHQLPPPHRWLEGQPSLSCDCPLRRLSSPLIVSRLVHMHHYSEERERELQVEL
jgi:hypothetical protein